MSHQKRSTLLNSRIIICLVLIQCISYAYGVNWFSTECGLLVCVRSCERRDNDSRRQSHPKTITKTKNVKKKFTVRFKIWSFYMTKIITESYCSRSIILF